MGYTVTQHTTTADARLITDKEVAHLLSVSRSWSWKLVQAGKFPAPIKLSARCTRWRLSAVHEWMADLQGWQEANADGRPCRTEKALRRANGRASCRERGCQ